MNAGIFLAAKYKKLIINMNELADELGINVGTAHNQVSAGTFPIPTRRMGKHRVADIRDLAEYLDRERAQMREIFGSYESPP